ncbi:L-rhamnose/proton symporter RhaT [Sodalis sp.]|uniref:L-rhamnose/proton symporter RhaT n=1 Tax=Sodalis sp. (in: enterobacteria) TaxID=1898979 RepID=UPI003873673B
MGDGAIVNPGYLLYLARYAPGISMKADLSVGKSLLIANALFSILAGVMQYLQFFFYSQGYANPS